LALDSIGFGGGTAAAVPPPPAEDRYPVNADFEPAGRRNRLWAIPVVGGAVKLVILIPHFIVIAILGILYSPTFSFRWGGSGQVRQITFAGLAFLILWLPVLAGGPTPLSGHGFVGGFLRWSTRLGAFLIGLTDSYPPFSMHSAGHPVDVRIHIPESNNRWWAFPIVGFYVKQLILIPHFLCLIGLGIGAVALWLVMWLPVLLTGTYPRGPYSYLCGVARWALRIQAFQGGLTDRYPPFSLS